jgi:hypothetical protein
LRRRGHHRTRTGETIGTQSFFSRDSASNVQRSQIAARLLSLTHSQDGRHVFRAILAG